MRALRDRSRLRWHRGELALLFRKLATPSTDVAQFENVEQLESKGLAAALDEIAARLGGSLITEKRSARPAWGG